MTTFTESVVEIADLVWLATIGWRVAHDSDIAPDMPSAERRNYGHVFFLAQWLGDALAYRNPQFLVDAFDDAFRKFTRHEHNDLIQRTARSTACL